MPEMSPDELVMLPWSIVGPRMVQNEQGNRHYEMRVKELPDFLVAGSTESEVLFGFKPAFLAFLQSLSASDLSQLPEGLPVRYTLFPARPGTPVGQAIPPDQPTTGATLSPASIQIE